MGKTEIKEKDNCLTLSHIPVNVYTTVRQFCHQKVVQKTAEISLDAVGKTINF